jgi:exodeoxyribonuclease VII small subunit
MDFEKKLTRLEEIVSKMEGGNLPLEEALKLFEEGVQHSRECQKQLTAAEEKIKVLLKVEGNGQAVTQDFSDDE